MKTYLISLGSVDKVKDFVDTVGRFPVDLDLASGRYVVDAKSIMGIFSLNLSATLELRVHGEPGPELTEAIRPYLVK